MKHGLKDMALGAGVASFVSSVLFALYFVYLALVTPVPYRDVFIREQWMEGEWLHVTATFIKTDCTFQRLSAVGYGLGVTYNLPWADREPAEGDRLLGLQTLRINVGGSAGLDAVELRTRHDCDGETVDSTFAWLDPSEVITRDNPRAANRGHLSPVR